MRRALNADLDQTVDEVDWVKENPVYCPIPWCSAHKLRFVRCGDADGPYEGLHVARIKYAPRFRANEEKRFRFFKKLGSADPANATWMARMIQDAVDQGMVRGRRGRRG